MSIYRTQLGGHVMDGTIEATVEPVSVRFEACAEFHECQHDVLVCVCGWLEEDHGELAAVRMKRRQRPTPRVTLPARRAS